MVFLFWIASISAYAADDTICGALSRPNDVLECAKLNAPEANQLQLQKEAAGLESKATLRWTNPEFSNQSLFAKGNGGSPYQIQFGLSQTFELGDRWSYKKQFSESLSTRAEAQYQVEMGEVLLRTGGDLVKLSFLEQEIHSINEALGTFSRLIAQFASRPRLSSEQEVTLSVYHLSQNDFLLRRSTLLNEREEIMGRFLSKLALSEEQLTPVLLKRSPTLPVIEEGDFRQEVSPDFKLLDAEVSLTLANLSLARADRFSDIKFGPLVQFENDGSSKTQFFGFQLAIPFPVLNQNGYGVDSAVQKAKAADIQSVLRKKGIAEEWRQSLKRYARLKALLTQIPSSDEIERSHKKVEAQIYRGLVNSALVVESHRSLIDLQKNRHEAELEALVTYWKILIAQGKFTEIRL